MYKVRKPNREEKKELHEWFKKVSGISDYHIEHIGVMENYISDCPGYTGKLMFMVYGFLEAYDLFCWRDGKIQKVERE